MGHQKKPDTPTIIKRIVHEASLPQSEQDKIHKLNRHQLLELFMYISELKRTNDELVKKINDLNTTGEMDAENN